ncbi:hypothetical protein [Curtobacterium sp. RRHDQ10]|uniref:hypothetical protein n=1 Tax=Curtobacterium phyllosphaerae TaxID=3413379 RepID=UPI003BF2421B
MTATAETPTRRHRGRTALIWAVSVVVVLAVLVVVAEFVLRGVVDRMIAEQVEQALPEGTTGQVDAHADGVVIPQLLSGNLDDVALSAKRITVRGIPLAVRATVHDVPVDGQGSTGAIDGRVTLAASAVDDLGVLDQVSGDITLRNGGIAYRGSTKIVGYQIDYRVLADLAAASNGQGIVVTPQKVSVTNTALGIDIGGEVPGVSGRPLTVCTAKYLPADLRLRSIDVTAADASVRVTAPRLPLSEQGLRATGSCPG